MLNNFWKFMWCLTVISFIFTIIFGSEISWKNINDISFSWTITKNILYDISVGIFSSMIIVWCIDRIQIKIVERENAKRRLFLYNKISPLLEDYYNFYLFLYIATRNIPVPPNSMVLRSLYLCKDEFIKQLYDTNPFYKDGYYGDSIKWNLQTNLMYEYSNDPQKIEKIMKMSISLPWYQCWNIEATKVYNGISQIEKDFPTFFPNDLLEQIDKLLAIVQLQTNMVNFVEGRALPDYIKKQVNIYRLSTEMFIEAYKIADVLMILESIMAYIEKDSAKKLSERSLEFFNNRNTSPIIGYTCKK